MQTVTAVATHAPPGDNRGGQHEGDELAASERRFRLVFDNGFQFTLLLDAKGCVREVNRAARRVFTEAGATVGRAKVWDCLWWGTDAAASARLRSAVEQARTRSPVYYEDELPAVSDAAGLSVVLEIAVALVPDASGLGDQFVVEVRDVSSRRRAELAQRELDALTMLGSIAAKVAHEINNPLAGIQYAFLLIKDAIPASHPQYEYVGAIEREIARIAAVTRQLYETFPREPELGSVTVLGNVVRDGVAFVQQVNRDSGVRIETDVTQAPALVHASGAVLRQVVYHLVQNAVDVSPPGARVRVSAHLRDDQLEICVSDAGPGVPAELRERIFDPFFSTKNKRGGASGLGLGLALVRRSVALASGQIRVESGPMGGALFIVTLPPRQGAPPT